MSAPIEEVAAGRVLPPLVGPPRRVPLPEVAARTLPNGLRVQVVRRTAVPLVELRLRVPFAGPTNDAGQHVAAADVLAASLLSGTQRHDAVGLAAALQELGGSLGAGTDADRLGISGSALAARLEDLLELLGEVLRGAAYPEREVVGERDRLVQELTIARSQPGTIAREALLTRLYGAHPYARELPPAEVVAGLPVADVRALHARSVGPAGSLLTLVGDVETERALDLVAAALGEWSSEAEAGLAPALPPQPAVAPLLVHRPGAVQTNLRFGGVSLRRSDPDYPALAVANTVFGGYFSSRLVANIREDKGYTYSPHSGTEHPTAGSRMVVDADVATPVTAPAVLETRYELGRIALLPVTEAELGDAQRYLTGTLALSTATGAGLASMLSVLGAQGLGVDYLDSYPAAVASVTAEQALAAARRVLAPERLALVLVGDADVVADDLRALGPLDVEGR